MAFKKLNDAMTGRAPAPAPKPKRDKTQVLGTVAKGDLGPSKDPVVMAEIAKRMAAQKAAENVVPQITRKK